MKIITDSASNLSVENAKPLDIEIIPFHITFRGKTYRDGVDLLPADLYSLYTQYPHDFVTTSQPSTGDFLQIYKRFPEEEILSIHLSSGLSGAYSSAANAAQLAGGDRVSVIDTKTVGPALGWLVEIAARGARSAWSMEKILATIKQVYENSLTMVAFTDLHYLIHSGRVSHLEGIIASLLKIKPVIGMNPVDGRYTNVAKEMTLARVAQRMGEKLIEKFGDQKIRLQLMHGDHLTAVDLLRHALQRMLDCVEAPLVPVTPVLGGHAGPTVFGLAAMPESLYQALYIG